jgi:threonine dehydratase
MNRRIRSTRSATRRGRCTKPPYARRSCRSAARPRRSRVFLKLETLQPIGSFKIRGAYNAVRRLTPAQLAEGVWTVSAGNAAQGVALAARKAGARCSVMVMDTAPEAKLANINRLGATIVKASYDECWKTVETHGSPRMTGHFVHPFDDDDFISGNGTAGIEIVGGPAGRRRGRRVGRRAAACSRDRRRDARAAPEGEGLRGRARDRRAAEAVDGARDGRAASKSGSRRSSTAPAASRCSTRCGRCLREYVDESIVVPLDDTARGDEARAERARVIAEGAGACAVAAAIFPTWPPRPQEDRRRRLGRQCRSRAVRAARRRLPGKQS